MLSAAAILMAMALGSTSLHAACTLDPTARVPAGGVKLQVLTFGDSLLDVGAYQKFVGEKFGGGKFTTNPAKLFIEDVACTFGDVLTPAFQGGFGQPLKPSGGFSYAQGGSRVTLQPGIGHPAAGTPNADFAFETTIPVAQQLNEYLSVYQRFHPNQLVVFNGGANDVFINLEIAQEIGTPAALQAAQQAIVQSALDLANLVDTALAKGATHVALMNMPDLGNTPQGFSSADHGQSLTQISQLFNSTMLGQLQSKGLLNKIVVLDTFGIIDNVVANFAEFGFQVSSNGMACNAAAEIAEATALKLANPSQFNDSLFCSPKTFTAPNADENFVFADTVHPTTHLSAIFAKAVETQLESSNLIK
ncbi:SGNH/GDSL hydrolase family protein [Granulicella sp. dw_53]|uniref:SGNH/GDSL hydrolase family protein n=1 Tax=Granulicella sp. dw_53 TaxID=2719792 RepID=UPI002102B9B2|nr:SGNH/GDSL hydrolase family protein [Granulicella sp. dw_53]